MTFITIKKLQREFGMSYLAAVNLLEERHRLARKRYRPLGVLIGFCMVAFVTLTITGIQNLRDVLRLIPVAMLPLVFMHLYLIHRVSRAPILAATLELQARGNASAPCRSE